jgi:hypothetical protein
MIRSLLALMLFTPLAASGQETLRISNITVVDVVNGALLAARTVTITDGRIQRIYAYGELVPDQDGQVVDGTGRFLIPGFADMHVHLYTEGDLLTYVARGITVVRNMAGDSTHLRMRRRVTAGDIIGPRIVTAGPVIEARPLSHPDNVGVDAPNTVREVVSQQKREGYDFVKVYNSLAAEVFDSLIAVTTELSIPVAGHVPVQVGLGGALGRQKSIEHFRGYPQVLAMQPLPDDAEFKEWSLAWNALDTLRIPDAARRTAERGTWNVPTFTFIRHEMQPESGHAELLARPELRYLSLSGLPTDRRKGYLAPFSEEDFKAVQRGLEGQFRLLRALEKAGAGLLVGTDSWLGGFAYADELELLVTAGLTPARVLRMATADAAAFLGQTDTWGRVEEGLRADLVVLDGNPLADIRNTQGIHAVVLGGRLLDRARLDALLASAERAAAERR